MFFSIKRKSVFMALGVIAFTVCLCFAVSATATRAYSAPKFGKTVVIDAGHGGADGGVVGKGTGIKESDINLAIARSLRHFLKTKGIDVVLTRQTSDGLYGMSTKNKKIKDMQERKRIINEAKADLVVSVHCNSYPREEASGAQVFYEVKSASGKANAEIMQKTLNTALNSSRIASRGDYFILQCSPTPSILVECGFLSNREEEKLLVSAAYQEKVAYNIFVGIVAILS